MCLFTRENNRGNDNGPENPERNARADGGCITSSRTTVNDIWQTFRERIRFNAEFDLHIFPFILDFILDSFNPRRNESLFFLEKKKKGYIYTLGFRRLNWWRGSIRWTARPPQFETVFTPRTQRCLFNLRREGLFSLALVYRAISPPLRDCRPSIQGTVRFRSSKQSSLLNES